MSTKVRFQRRKSAHGRLQSSASSLTAAERNAHTDSSDRDGVGKRKEAAVEVKKGRSRRVKSARETRLEQEKSDIFPSSPPSAGATGVWGRTQYGDDYGRKEPVKPVPVRPLSPTRRNNPHPAKVRERERERDGVSPAHFIPYTHALLSVCVAESVCTCVSSFYLLLLHLILPHYVPFLKDT